ncbi:MAG: response regulator containing CheY-like receiver domain and AraC-type DNA-binding domain [Eubacterium sp.]|nr:response regulator containing CheY-like receiver domain and AraC-type DNA-binding domain [Eubacterium sp.]
MYRVFLVEDEIVMREAIRDSVKWEQHGFIFCGEAPDGEIALPLIEEVKPDILVTDIRMPFMDGLALSRVIKKNIPNIKIIILSGHDEFNYAKEALNIGIEEYLLKPVDSTELMETLKRVASKLDSENNERIRLERLEGQLESEKSALRDKFLGEFILGWLNSNEAIEQSINFNIILFSKWYSVLYIDASNDLRKTDCIEKIICKIEGNNPNIIGFHRSKDYVVLLKGEGEASLNSKTEALSEKIKEYARGEYGYELMMGIGCAVDRMQNVPKSYREAEAGCKYRKLIGNRTISHISDIRLESDSKGVLPQFDEVNWDDFFVYGNKAMIPETVEKYVRCLEKSGTQSFLYMYYSFVNIILAARRFVEGFGSKLDNVIPEIANVEDIACSLNSLAHFKEIISETVCKVMEYRNEFSENKYGEVIATAKEFIFEKYSDANLSLSTVASKVMMSPSHFSTIFAAETGETFIEFLTKVRINKAKELLKTTNMLSADIAYETGYNDPHYFSNLFKKQTGYSPRNFKKLI